MPANRRVSANLLVASDASIASDAKPPIPTAAPRSASGPSADVTNPTSDETPEPTRPREESTSRASRSTLSASWIQSFNDIVKRSHRVGAFTTRCSRASAATRALSDATFSFFSESA